MATKTIKKRGPYKQYIHDRSKKLPKSTFYYNLKNDRHNNRIQLNSNVYHSRIEIQCINQRDLTQSTRLSNVDFNTIEEHISEQDNSDEISQEQSVNYEDGEVSRPIDYYLENDFDDNFYFG